MKSVKVNFWLLVVVLLLALLLAPRIEGQRGLATPSPGVVFVGWLERADCLLIHLPNGITVSYGGEKLQRVVADIKGWQERAPEETSEPPKS